MWTSCVDLICLLFFLNCRVETNGNSIECLPRTLRRLTEPNPKLQLDEWKWTIRKGISGDGIEVLGYSWFYWTAVSTVQCVYLLLQAPSDGSTKGSSCVTIFWLDNGSCCRHLSCWFMCPHAYTHPSDLRFNHLSAWLTVMVDSTTAFHSSPVCDAQLLRNTNLR